VVEISLHVLDLLENSIEAGARTVTVTVRDIPGEHLTTLEIIDDGRGMDAEFVRRVTDPFVTTRTTRPVGLGLPLLMQSAEASGGSLEISSAKGKGTRVFVTFQRENIDRPPLGDMAATMSVAIATNPGVRFRYVFHGKKESFIFDSAELETVLDGVPVSDPAVVQWIRKYIRENESEVLKG